MVVAWNVNGYKTVEKAEGSLTEYELFSGSEHVEREGDLILIALSFKPPEKGRCVAHIARRIQQKSGQAIGEVLKDWHINPPIDSVSNQTVVVVEVNVMESVEECQAFDVCRLAEISLCNISSDASKALWPTVLRR